MDIYVVVTGNRAGNKKYKDIVVHIERAMSKEDAKWLVLNKIDGAVFGDRVVITICELRTWHEEDLKLDHCELVKDKS